MGSYSLVGAGSVVEKGQSIPSGEVEVVVLRDV